MNLHARRSELSELLRASLSGLVRVSERASERVSESGLAGQGINELKRTETKCLGTE